MKAYNEKQRQQDIKAFNHSAKLKTLILAAMERWTPEEMLDMMYYKCLNRNEADDLKSKMIELTTLEDGIFIKTKELGIDKKDELNDFINQKIYPSYNEQIANLFYY